MGKKRTHKDLKIWQKASEIFEMVCEDVKSWSNNSISRAISYQLLDSSGSIGANVAEGYGRGGPKEFEQFLRYAKGSASESEHWLYHANKQNLVTNERFTKYEEVFGDWYAMTASFVFKLRQQ